MALTDTTLVTGRSIPRTVAASRNDRSTGSFGIRQDGKGGTMELRVGLNALAAALSFAFLAAIVFATL